MVKETEATGRDEESVRGEPMKSRSKPIYQEWIEWKYRVVGYDAIRTCVSNGEEKTRMRMKPRNIQKSGQLESAM